jgi:hypothetical protein
MKFTDGQIPVLRNDDVTDEDGGQQSKPKIEHGPQTASCAESI